MPDLSIQDVRWLAEKAALYLASLDERLPSGHPDRVQLREHRDRLYHIRDVINGPALTRVEIPSRGEQMKRCSKCGETKPLDEFWSDPHTKSGVHTHCKPCHRAFARETQRKIRQRAKSNAAETRSKWAEVARQAAEGGA